MKIVADQLRTLPCGSVIQHGVLNDRVYLMKTGERVSPDLAETLKLEALKHGYSKVFAKIPAGYAEPFRNAGYHCGAVVPGLYNRREDGLFMEFFLNRQRADAPEPERLDAIVALSRNRVDGVRTPLGSRFMIRRCGEADVVRMAGIYRKVFAVYPFPIHDPEYLRCSMREHVTYFGVEADGELVALASAEVCPASGSAEMTDFAMLPEWRGHRLAEHLLAVMELAMEESGIQTLFTIARAVSVGMNVTFARGNYRFGGRLVNNTYISSGIESMNIWFKPV